MSKEYRRKKKLYNKELKKLNKEHTPQRHDRIAYYNGRKEGGPIVRNQADGDGAYFLDLVIYKLERMYINLNIFSNEVREDLDKRLATLKEVIDLGKKIQNYDYDIEYHEGGKKHCAHVINIHPLNKDPFFRETLHKIIYWNDCKEDEDTDIGLDYISGKKNLDVIKWAKENGYDVNQLCCSYSGEWDDEQNYKIWQKLIKKANKQKQDDTDKFFKLISRNYEKGWG